MSFTPKLEVKEADGSPDVDGVKTIVVPNGTLTNNNDGSVTLAGGLGGVTSVALTAAPTSIFDVSGSPITSSGTLALSMDNQNANIVLAGPSSGAAATPAFRALVSDDIPNLAASKITSGQLALARGGTNADLSAAGPGALWQITNGGNVQDIEPVIIRVKNNSGATANANEIGLLDRDGTYGFSYTTTTTANKEGMWCVVVVGGTNTSDIWVSRRGQVTIKLNANCSIGDYLSTSTTAGQASVSTVMKPDTFAIAMSANSGGAGGTCSALLVTNTRVYPFTNSNDTVRIISMSSTNFVATINGTPSGTSVVYNAPSSGSDNTIVPLSSSQAGKIVLYNTTRSNSALISSVNTGTKTITLTATVPASWASGDSITARSQTATGEIESGIGDYFFDLDLSGLSLPALTRSAAFHLNHNDSAVNASIYAIVHPFQAVSGPFSVGDFIQGQGNGLNDTAIIPINILSGKICFGLRSSGSATGAIIIRIREVRVAEP